jgi:hypothetical protein
MGKNVQKCPKTAQNKLKDNHEQIIIKTHLKRCGNSLKKRK